MAASPSGAPEEPRQKFQPAEYDTEYLRNDDVHDPGIQRGLIRTDQAHGALNHHPHGNGNKDESYDGDHALDHFHNAFPPI